jgi:uncharacterized protein (TIGR00303 family)
MQTVSSDILKIYRPAQGEAFITSLHSLAPVFSLVVAYTATVQLAGLSGAGTTPELRELTAIADAEILYYGHAPSLKGGVPSNPTGAPGPSIITRAACKLLPQMPYICVNAGLKGTSALPIMLNLEGATPAAAVSSGQALPLEAVEQLFESGLALGHSLSRQYGPKHYLIIAESVPGGTTTALGLLLALGVNAEQRVSSSMPDNAHSGKLAAVQAGLEAAGKFKGAFANTPLAGVAALGDPMQVVVAGMALAASEFGLVVLGGGTQMAAVIALMAALRCTPKEPFAEAIAKAQPKNIALATTRWVSSDTTADLAGLGAEIESRFGPFEAPYLAANLDFSQSHYLPMRLYEQGYVKEGVGAGAAALAAMINGPFSAIELLQPIEEVYEELVLH